MAALSYGRLGQASQGRGWSNLPAQNPQQLLLAIADLFWSSYSQTFKKKY